MKQLLSLALLLGIASQVLQAATTRTFGGYMDTEFIGKSGTDSTYRAHRLVLDFASQVHENVQFNSEIEYEYGANVDNDGEIKIEKAYVDFKISDALVQRTGIVLVPFGHVNLHHDSDARDTTDRPIYSKYIVPSTWSDTGFGFYGEFEMNDMDYKYEAYIVNGLNDDISSTSGVRSARPSFKTDNNGDKAFVGRLSTSPKLGLDVGASYYRGAYDDGGHNALSIVGLDSFYKKGRTEVVAEYAVVSLEDSGSIPDFMNGGYVEGRYHILQKQLRELLPSFKNPVITLFGRYGMVNLDADTDDNISRVTVGANFRPTETFVYKVEYGQQENADSSTDKFVNASVALGF